MESSASSSPSKKRRSKRKGKKSRRGGGGGDSSPDRHSSSEGSDGMGVYVNSDPNAEVKRFSAGTNEVVGPPPKKTVGCCRIM